MQAASLSTQGLSARPVFILSIRKLTRQLTSLQLQGTVRQLLCSTSSTSGVLYPFRFQHYNSVTKSFLLQIQPIFQYAICLTDRGKASWNRDISTQPKACPWTAKSYTWKPRPSELPYALRRTSACSPH